MREQNFKFLNIKPSTRDAFLNKASIYQNDEVENQELLKEKLS
jgi:hypothetical protein